MTALLWVLLIGGVLVAVGGFRLLGAVLGLTLLLGIAGIAILIKKENADAEARRRRNESVSVEWVPSAAVAERLSEDLFRSVNDTLPALAFRLCNEGPETVRRVEFRPQTWHPNRSTAYDVVLAKYSYDRDLWSDHYLAPSECKVLTWQGTFQVFHRIEARSVDVTTETP